MPAEVRDDMLTAMRDHLMNLDTIVADVASERYQAAAKLAEDTLATHSFDSDGAKRVAAYLPQPMNDATDTLRDGARRFAKAARTADAERSYRAMKEVAGA